MILITASNFVAIKKAKKFDRIIDVLEDSPSDYSLLLTKIPSTDTELDIKKYISDIQKDDKKVKVSGVRAFTNFLSRLGDVDSSDEEEEDTNTTSFQVQKVSKVFRLENISKVLDKILKLRQKRAKKRVQVMEEMGQGNVKEAHKCMRSVLELKRQIKTQKEKYAKLKSELHTKKYSTGSCFVSFKFKGDRDQFIDKFESTFLNTYVFPTQGFQYKGKGCNVYEADEPTDILWENLG
jgi:hypothetical protein